MNVTVIALLAFFAGCVFLGLIVFLVMLYRAFGQMRQTFEITSMHMENLAERIPEMLIQWNELADKMMNSSETCVAKIVSSQELATFATRDQAAVSNKASAVFAELGEQVKLLIKSFNVFNSMVWKKPEEAEFGAEPSLVPPTRQPEGTFFGYDEVKIAANESVTEARKHGIELEESALFRPDPSRMVGGDGNPKSNDTDSRRQVPPAQDPSDASGGNSEAG